MAKTAWLDRRIAAPGPHLALCLDEPAFFTALKDIGCGERPSFIATPQANATLHSLSTPKGHLACIVCLSDWAGRNPIEVAGLLVHEAVHVWQKYCAHIGEYAPGAEQEAYAVQAISQELMDSFATQTKGMK